MVEDLFVRRFMKKRKKFNNAYFFDTLILMYLFKKGTVSTDDMEKLFGARFNDEQNVNNVVSNKKNSTSFIAKGLMEYNVENHTLSITKKGKLTVKKWFSKRREYAKKSEASKKQTLSEGGGT